MSRLMEAGVSFGKPEDVARVSDRTHGLPGEQELPILADLVLPLLGGDQRIGVDAFNPDEDARYARRRALLDEFRDLVAQRIDLNHQADADTLFRPQSDDAVKDGLPVLVAGEVVIGDEEAVNPFRPVLPDDPLDVVGRAPSRFPSLHVNDGAERALVRAAAAGIEGRVIARRALDVLAQQEGYRRRLDRRKVVEIIVDRLEGTRLRRRAAGCRAVPRLRPRTS